MHLLMNFLQTCPYKTESFELLLLDQITLLDDIEKAAKKTNAIEVLQEIEYKRNQINRKLYQKPPLTNTL